MHWIVPLRGFIVAKGANIMIINHHEPLPQIFFGAPNICLFCHSWWCALADKGVIQSFTSTFIKVARLADICVCTDENQFILGMTPAPEMDIWINPEPKKKIIIYFQEIC